MQENTMEWTGHDRKNNTSVLSFDHMRVARMEVPGEIWDQLFALHDNDLSALGASIAPYCEVYDTDTYNCLINISLVLQDKNNPEVAGRLAPLIPFLHHAQSWDYDYLLIGS